MAAFKDYLTIDGQALITKMLAGKCKIKFTRIVFGDGYLPVGSDPRNMKSLVNQKCESTVAAGYSDSIVTITGTFSNKDFGEAMYLREKGIYATDGEDEVLIMYANNGDTAEYIQPGVSALVEKVIRTIMRFSPDDIVNIEVSSGIYVTVENYQHDNILIEEKFETVNNIIKEMKEYECKIAPRYVTDIGVESGDTFVYLTWTDPGETYVDGVKIALWDGTKLVMNEEHYPESVDDGILLLDNTEKNLYQTKGFKVDGLVNKQNYFFRFFPYCVCGGINDYSEENKIIGVPGIIPTAPVTNIAAVQNDASIILKWTDPNDVPETGVKWAKTVVVYKTGSFPKDITDGIALESTVSNQYKNDGLAINDIESGVMYYFSFFPISSDGIINFDESQRITFMAQLELEAITGISVVQNVSNIILTWTDPEDHIDTGVKWGKTVIVYKTGSYPTSINDGTVITENVHNQYKNNGLVITGVESAKTYFFALYPVATNGMVNTSTSQRISITPQFATINVSTTATDLYGKRVTAVCGNNSVAGVFDTNGKCVLNVPWTGTTVVKCEQSLGICDNVTLNISSMAIYAVNLNLLKIVTWASGSWEDIKAMINAHYAGKIKISDYWSIGNERIVTLPALPASGVKESHAKQNIVFQIIAFNHDVISDNSGKAAITLCMKDALNEKGEMNTRGGMESTSHYSTSTRRTWINNVFEKALPIEMQALIKNIKKVTCTNNVLVNSVERCFMFSNWEVLGCTYIRNDTFKAIMKADGEQYDFFKTRSNRFKKVDGTTYAWTGRSGMWDDVDGNNGYADGYICFDQYTGKGGQASTNYTPYGLVIGCSI